MKTQKMHEAMLDKFCNSIVYHHFHLRCLFDNDGV